MSDQEQKDEMKREKMALIWERHNKSKCDCSDGDAYHTEPECYIAMGFLKGEESVYSSPEIRNLIEAAKRYAGSGCEPTIGDYIHNPEHCRQCLLVTALTAIERKRGEML